MTVTIYHNPACGTSRNTLALIRATGIEPDVIHYLEHAARPRGARRADGANRRDAARRAQEQGEKGRGTGAGRSDARRRSPDRRDGRASDPDQPPDRGRSPAAPGCAAPRNKCSTCSIARSRTTSPRKTARPSAPCAERVGNEGKWRAWHEEGGHRDEWEIGVGLARVTSGLRPRIRTAADSAFPAILLWLRGRLRRSSMPVKQQCPCAPAQREVQQRPLLSAVSSGPWGRPPRLPIPLAGRPRG